MNARLRHRLSLLLACLAGAVTTARAQITYEGQVTRALGGGTTATNLAWTISVAARPHRALVLALGIEGAPAAPVTGVFYGAQSFVKVAESNPGTETPHLVSQLWVLDDPVAGTRDMNITLGGPLPPGAGLTACVSGYSRVGPPLPAAVAASGPMPAGNAYSLAITNTVAGAWLVDSVTSSAATGFAVGTPGMVERWDTGTGAMAAAGSTRFLATSGDFTNTWTAASATGTRAHTALLLAPAPPGPPEVTITSPQPFPNQVPGQYFVVAQAVDDTAVARVDFYENSVWRGTDTTAPYQVHRAGATNGTPYTWTAVAVDNLGNATTSTPVNVTVRAPVSVAAGGTGVREFSTVNDTFRLFTASIPGFWLDAVDGPGLDPLVNVLSVADMPHPLGTQATGAASSNAYWRSDLGRIATQPFGGRMTTLLAPLRNVSTNTVDALAIRYRLGVGAVSPGEWFRGHRAYWSGSGLPGSWLPLGDALGAGTGSERRVLLARTGLGWLPGTDRFLLWADDTGSSPNGEFTLDGLEILPLDAPVVELTGPALGASVGRDVWLDAAAFTGSGTVARVEFLADTVPLGQDDSAPFSLAWLDAPAGPHALQAVAVDSLGRRATSAVVTVTVDPGPGTLLRGPYLQMAGPDRMTVRWRTSHGARGVVRFGAAAGSLTNAVAETLPLRPPHDHEVTLTNLTAATTHFYSVGSGTNALQQGADTRFTTAPTPGTPAPARIWAIGDAGKAGSAQNAVRAAFLAWTGARDPDLVLQLGDNAYNAGTDDEYQAALFNPFAPLLRRVPFWSCLGNHETDQAGAHRPSYAYFDIYTQPTAGECGGLASGTEHYYSFDFGNVHLISLDTMTASRAANGPMAAWLENDLASTTATWILCFFHHPPYTKGSHNSDVEADLVEVRSNLLPILEAGGVDLVLNGHSHSYERSFLLDGHYGFSGSFTPAMKRNPGDGRPAGNGAYVKPLTGPRDRFGTVYIVAGSSSQISGGAFAHPAHFISRNNLGSVVLDISTNRLDAVFLRENGTEVDTFTLIKQGAADSDGDGIPDAVEITEGLDRRNAADALLDPDGDGASNLVEYGFATDMGAHDRYAFATAYNAAAGTATVTFPTVTGRTYRVLHSPHLLSWAPGSPPIPGTGAVESWTDDGSTTGSPPSALNRRYYRIEVTVDP